MGLIEALDKISIRKEGKPGRNQDPVPIRGHHLRNYQYLLLNGSTPEEHARGTREANFPFPMVSPMTDEETTREIEEVVKDTYGINNQTADDVQAAHTAFYTTFANLPNNARVQITEGKKDGLCQGCFIGQHCTTVSIFEADSKYIDLFLSLTPRRKYSLSFETVVFSNAEPREARAVKTKAGTVRKVIQNRRFKLPYF